MRHPLVRLGGLIDWPEIERTFGASFTSGRGRPALPARLVAGRLYLQHTFDASAEAVVNTWVENPYWQYFCGETYLQIEAPVDPSASCVIVDTTVMSKAIAHPTDGRLLERSRRHLVKVATAHGLRLRLRLRLRQNYNRVAPRLAAQIGRYAHARPFKRMHRAVRLLRTRVGRVQREIERQFARLPESARSGTRHLPERTGRILTQRKKDLELALRTACPGGRVHRQRQGANAL